MRFLIVLMVLSSLAFAEVIPGTLHLSDAQAVDDLMESWGIDNGRVKIVNFRSITFYACEFPGDYYDWDDDSDIEEICAFFLSVAAVSTNTSWHSDIAAILYEDSTVSMFTADCRTIKHMVERGDDFTYFFGDNILFGDRAGAELRL